MKYPVRVLVNAHDLSVIVDAKNNRAAGPREIERCERATAQHETMHVVVELVKFPERYGTGIVAGQVSKIIKPANVAVSGRCSLERAWVIEGGKRAIA